MKLTQKQIETLIRLIQKSKILTAERKLLWILQLGTDDSEILKQIYGILKKETEAEGFDFTGFGKEEIQIVQECFGFLQKQDIQFIADLEKRTTTKEEQQAESLLN